MTRRQQILLLLVIGSIWVGLLAWRITQADEERHVPLVNVSGSTVRVPASGETQRQGLRVNLELLAASRTERETTFTTPRNIFAPLQVGQDGAGAAPVLDAANPIDSEAALMQQAAAAELGQFYYLGYLQVGDTPRQRRPVALVMKNEDVHMVRTGETIEDHILVKTITPESITLQETGSRVEQSVPLAQEPIAQ